jgi:hypothetical protein
MGAVFSTQAIESTVKGLIVDISKDLGVATGVEAAGPLGLGEGVDVEMLLQDPEQALRKLTEGMGVSPNITSISGIDPETGEPTSSGGVQGAGQADPVTGEPITAQPDLSAPPTIENLDAAGIEQLLGQMGLESVVDRLDLQKQAERVQAALWALMLKLALIAVVTTLACAWGAAAAIRGAAGQDPDVVASLVNGLIAIPWQTSQVGWAYLPVIVVQLIPAVGMLVHPLVGLWLLMPTILLMIPLALRGSFVAVPAAVRSSLGERSWRPSTATRGYKSQRLTVAWVVICTGIVLFLSQLPTLFLGPLFALVLAPALIFCVGVWVALDSQIILPGGMSAAEARLIQSTRLQVAEEQDSAEGTVDLSTLGTSEHGEWILVPTGPVVMQVSWSGPAAPQIWTCDPAGNWLQHQYAESGGVFSLNARDERVYVAARGLADVGVTTIRLAWARQQSSAA